MVSKKSLAQGGEAALDSLTGSAAAPPRPNRQNAATKRTQLHRFRSHRWSARETNRRILRGTRCAFCGKPTKKGTGVGLYYDPEHGSRFGGLAACGNVNCCPVCNYKIMSQRQNEISQALHACKENGYGVVFGTLTLRHTKADDLASIRKKLLEVWRNLNKQRAFVKLMDDFGEFGFIRAQEVTYSNVNGWHPHLHAFFLFEHDLSVKRVNEFGARFAALWLKTVQRLNAKRAKAGLDDDYAAPLIDSIGMPLAKNQIFKRVSLSDSGIDKYAAYCTVRKSVALPGEDVISRMSHEIADSGTKVGKVKKHDDGRKVLHMNYWDMLEFLRQIGYTGSKKSPIFSIMSENGKHSPLVRFLSSYGYTIPQIVALCREFYKGTKGSRSLYWSRVRRRKVSLREFLGIGAEKTDEELAQQEYTDPKSHVLSIWDWSKCLSRRDHLAADLLNFCDDVAGDPEQCRSWCVQHRIIITPPNLRHERFSGPDKIPII